MDAPALLISGDAVITGGNFVQSKVFNTFLGETPSRKELIDYSAPEAIHTSKEVTRQDLCTPGTRTFTLQHLHSLITSAAEESPDVIWMHGPAGSGKSAIMRTMAKSLASEGLLLASFFFFRTDAKRNMSAPFVPTVALQMAKAFPETQSHVSLAMLQDPTLFTQPANLQGPILIETPLFEALNVTAESGAPHSSDKNMVIFVDGLDECTDPEGQTEIIDAMAQLASSIRSRTGRHLKIVLASRPEYRIKTAFNALTIDEKAVFISLDSSDANIELYYDKCLEEIRAKFNFPESWPSQEDTQWLRKMSSGQYAFAGVATRFLAGGNPIVRLQIIREALYIEGLEPFAALDALYATVFAQLPPEMTQPALRILRLRFNKRWSMKFNPILEHLLQLPSGYVQSLSPFLAPLINFDDNLSPYHATLPDFLADSVRSEKFSLFINPRPVAEMAAKGLFAILSLEPRHTFSNQEMAAFSEFIENSRVFSDGALRFHIGPHDELNQQLKAINLHRLSAWSFCYFRRLHRAVYKQLIERGAAHVNPDLWKTVTSVLPREMAALSTKRLSLYEGIPSGDGSLAVGLMLICCTTMSDSDAKGSSPINNPHNVLSSLLTHIIQESPALSSVDSEGWNFAEAVLSTP